MTTASLRFVTAAMSATMSFIVPMSPFPWTPQSTRMYRGPVAVGSDTRKQSPKPTRYIRTEIEPPGMPGPPPPPAPPPPFGFGFGLGLGFGLAFGFAFIAGFVRFVGITHLPGARA